MRNPYTELRTGEIAQHHGVVLGDGEADEGALELVGVIVLHAVLQLMLGVE